MNHYKSRWHTWEHSGANGVRADLSSDVDLDARVNGGDFWVEADDLGVVDPIDSVQDYVRIAIDEFEHALAAHDEWRQDFAFLVRDVKRSACEYKWTMLVMGSRVSITN